MASVEDRLATAMPRWLIVAAVLALFARAAVFAYQSSNPRPPVAHVEWRDLLSVGPLPRQSGKPILYEFYADWSEPCKRMENDVLVNRQIKTLIEEKFVPLRVTDQLKAKGKNLAQVTDLQKKYRVFAFPTLVAVGPDGEPIGTLVGRCSSVTVYRFLARLVKDRP